MRRSSTHLVLMIVVAVGSLLSWVMVQRASEQIGVAADRLITQAKALAWRQLHMISITYQSADGAVTVTTQVGDQQDGEPVGLVERQAERLEAAKTQWPQV